MHVQPVVNDLVASLRSHRALANDDPSLDDAVSALVEALGPALRLAAMELAQQAAAEVGAQLADRTVDVLVVDGDPALRVSERSSTDAGQPPEEFDARITLRLPPSLKNLIEESASVDGDSVNGWVVDALTKRARRSPDVGRRVTHGFDL